MPSYTVKITKHWKVDTTDTKRIKGADAEKICEVFGAEMQEGYRDEKYVEIEVPCVESRERDVYEQTLDKLDVSALVVAINNNAEVEEEKK